MFLDPRNDVAFKKVFGSEEHKGVTISFLNSILGYSGDHTIVDVQFLNTEQNPIILKEKKENILDILCTDQLRNQYIVEMQVARIDEFGKRMVYYGAKAYAMQLGKSRPYNELAPVIVIAIIDFVMFPQKTHYKSIHRILDVKTQECDLPELSFVFVELKKFKKQENELISPEDKWFYFIKEIGEHNEVPAPLAKAEFAEACHVVERMTWTEAELNAYDRALIKATDSELIIKAALREGLEKGIQEGREKGIKEGIKEGVQKVVLAMLKKGIDSATIAACTNLSIDEVNALKDKLGK